MKKKIIFFSGSRADFDLIKPIYELLKKNKKYKTNLLVTGTNLDKKYSDENVNKLKNNFLKIKVNLKSSKKKDFSKIFSEYFNNFFDFLIKFKPSLIVLLGDRYEVLALSIVAKFLNCKVIHLHGGETTKGSLDDVWRNVISILSDFHFTSLNIYKEKVKRISGNYHNVYNLGSIGAYNIKNIKQKIIFNKKYPKKILVSYHSATYSISQSRKDFLELLKALSRFKNFLIFFTYPGHDIDSDFLIKKILNFKKKNRNVIFVKKVKKYSYGELLNSFDILVGNSSAGIIEAPSARIPSLNIGNRQMGRISGPSVFNTLGNKKFIFKKINFILNKKKINFHNPYYKKNILKNMYNKIIKIIKNLD